MTSDLAAYERPTAKSLADMADEVYEVNLSRGWQPSTTFGDSMALLHSEVSEALEAYRDTRLADATAHDPSCRVLGMEERPCSCDAKPEGVGSEFADILIRLLDDAKMYGIDLEAEYERKIKYNRTRAWRHGGRTL